MLETRRPFSPGRATLCSLLLWAAGAQAGEISVVSTTQPISVDGRLDEPIWQSAPAITEFMRFQPTEGGAPPGITEVRFLQDERFLYVGAKVADADYPIRARISPREQINADDQIGIYLDTFDDDRTGYIFYFNGRGIQQDIRVGPGFASFSWNTVLKTGGTVQSDGYTIEIAIPWRSLKYPRVSDPQQWGLIITRKIPSEGAKYSFPVTERNHPRIFTQAAPLTNVRPAPRGSGVELIPSITMVQQATRSGDDDQLRWIDLGNDSPGATERWLQVIRPSMDARVGITANLGLTATINPDFSQVDQDPTFINLNQRFAFFLPENRPFFLDGSEYFADSMNSLYTRSIVDPVYGTKLSGRAGRWSTGVLHALDRSPNPSVHEGDTPGFSEDDVQGAVAATQLARTRVDAFGDGFIGTTITDKRLIGPGSELRGSNTTGAVDFRIPLGERWTFDGGTQQSWTSGQAGESIWGQNVQLGLARAPGIGWGTVLFLSDRTLGYRQETGFLNQSGITDGFGRVEYTFEPSGVFDTITPVVEGGIRYERNGEYGGFADVDLEVLINGIHRIELEGGIRSNREGLGPDASGRSVDMVTVTGAGIEASYRAELGRIVAVQASLGSERVLDFDVLAAADETSASTTITLRPTPGLRLDTTMRADRLGRVSGPTGTAALIRHWTTWQFTKELGFRSMVEWSSGNERTNRLATTALLTWLQNPQTAVHLGWIERTAFDDAPKTIDRSVFLKGTVLFRP